MNAGKDHKKSAWHPSGIREKDLPSTKLLCFLQKWDALWRHVQKQEAKNRQVAELQLRGQAWQALRREQSEPVAVLRGLGEEGTAGPRSRDSQGRGLVAQHAGPGQAALRRAKMVPGQKQ